MASACAHDLGRRPHRRCGVDAGRGVCCGTDRPGSRVVERDCRYEFAHPHVAQPRPGGRRARRFVREQSRHADRRLHQRWGGLVAAGQHRERRHCERGQRDLVRPERHRWSRDRHRRPLGHHRRGLLRAERLGMVGGRRARSGPGGDLGQQRQHARLGPGHHAEHQRRPVHRGDRSLWRGRRVGASGGRVQRVPGSRRCPAHLLRVSRRH